jgi:hypothetical protein
MHVGDLLPNIPCVYIHRYIVLFVIFSVSKICTLCGIARLGDCVVEEVVQLIFIYILDMAALSFCSHGTRRIRVCGCVSECVPGKLSAFTWIRWSAVSSMVPGIIDKKASRCPNSWPLERESNRRHVDSALVTRGRGPSTASNVPHRPDHHGVGQGE